MAEEAKRVEDGHSTEDVVRLEKLRKVQTLLHKQTSARRFQSLIKFGHTHSNPSIARLTIGSDWPLMMEAS